MGAGARFSTPDVVARHLRRLILDGTLCGGTQLKQNDMARQFGVSIVPVREAFQRLVAEGLAVLHPNRGVSVTRLSERDFVEIAELRGLLERHALRLSGPRLTRSDLDETSDVLARATACGDPFERAELHWLFHRRLYERAERPRLLAQLSQLYASINRYLLPTWTRIGLSEGWEESHRAILDALRARDFDGACDLVGRQIVEARERMCAELRPLIERQEGTR